MSESLITKDLQELPDGWHWVPVGDAFDFKNGLNKAKQYFGKGTPIVNYMDVFRHRGLLAGEINGKVTVNSDELKNYEARIGDVFFTRTSETVEEIGISSVVLGDIKDTVFSGFILRARPKNELLATAFCQYCFSSSIVREQIVSKSTYTTRALTNGTSLSKVLVPAPIELDEQIAIAEALKSVEALIASLDELIEKKWNIKQGAMQLLLTGKKRLAGFTEEWKTKALGEIGIFRGGNGFPEKYQNVSEGAFPFFKVSDMNNVGNEIEMSRANHYVSEQTRRVVGGFPFPKTTIVFAKIGAAIFLERKRLLNQISCIDNNMMGFMLQSKDACVDFIFYQMLSLQFGRLVSTSALPSLSGKELAEIFIPFPRFEEQEAIANAFADLDAEIAQLFHKKDKYLSVKQGMMQELLTGQTRLV